MELLKRAIAVRQTVAQSIVGSTFTMWVEYDGEEVQVACIGGRAMDAGKPLPGGGFLRMEQRDISIHVAISALPEGYVLKEKARFYAGPSATRATAKSYTIESWDDLSHLAAHVEIRGSRGK